MDLLSVMLTVVGPKGRRRKVDLLHTLTESEVMSMEDEAEAHSNSHTGERSALDD
tara:strand:- start:589 stop:753 length:165 start_codon:yes stop_codon:yes gene_type:complete